ncbi:MAG TPA: CBS domain-containing protein [Gemmatimonadales bacterium]
MATVKDILSRKGDAVVTVSAEGSVLDAARLMNERGIGGVVVTDGGTIAGIFTERDILRRVVAKQLDPASTKLTAVMTTPVTRCRPEATVDEVMAVISGKRIRHIPVVDGDRLCGIVTSGDVLAHQVQEQQDTIQYLNSYVFDTR